MDQYFIETEPIITRFNGVSDLKYRFKVLFALSPKKYQLVIMMILKEIHPCTSLREYIRFYRIIDFEFPDDTPIPPKAYPPRPEHCLQFFPTPTSITYANSTGVIKPAHALLIGQHTIVNHRTIYRKFLSLQVVFQPGALYRLLGIPMKEFSNRLTEASDVFGHEVANVNEQLYYAASHADMISTVEKFLYGKVNRVKKDVYAIDTLMKRLLAQNSPCTLDWLVSHACVSHRQFDRQFIERTGIGAKEFLRVTRFYQAYLMKNRFVDKDWLSIAIDCGYYDYQHLAKDYRDFTGHTPVRFFSLDSPERTLGAEEVY